MLVVVLAVGGVLRRVEDLTLNVAREAAGREGGEGVAAEEI